MNEGASAEGCSTSAQGASAFEGYESNAFLLSADCKPQVSSMASREAAPGSVPEVDGDRADDED